MLSSFTAEAKQRVVEDLARDPNSKVTAEDVEQVMLDEGKKAGAPTFQFDANATPEQKAAQARAQGNNLHSNRPKGAGLKSDINDGPDDYDLPPPSTAGALALPSGDKDQVNGVRPEEDQWKKTGWAPQFGTTDTKSMQDDALISDHQTFLEGKLDDKFFGDWYHNAAVIVFACLSSWLVAICGGGLGWVMIVMAACGTHYRTSIRRVRRNFRDDITRELAKGRLENDHETLEWLNSFLVKFWPIFAPNLAASVIQSVDQVLSTSTPAFLDSMRMEHFTLGTKPPRMEHVKTYPKEDPDIVIMDWRFSFTPTDTMDMTVRQLQNKINPKVVLEIRIGKAMVSKSMKIIVEDFAFSGIMRIKMKLQLAFPYVERVDMCFLERPEIDYVCKPLGGDTFGFDINFIPGLETFIKEQIHANLAPIMYAPNVFPIEVAKMLSGNPVDMAIGVVAITLHGAHGLRNPDKFSGTPDPYVVLSINGRNELGRTKTKHETSDPQWNETLYIIITNFTDSLSLQVFDFNEIRKDKELGTANFPLEKLESLAEHEHEQLEVVAGGKQRGLINCDIRFFPVLESAKDGEGNALPPPESNTGIARITIEQAKDLDGTKSMVGQLNPYGVLVLNGKEVHTTGKLKRTNNPIFTNPSTSVLVTDKKKARVGLIIKDDRDLQTDPIIGRYQIKLDDMLTLMQKGQEWFNLADSKTGRAKLTIDWKPVALSGVTSAGGYLTPIGVLRVHFQKANDLKNLETLGKSDPYARVSLNGIQKGRTVTFKNNLEPTWDEIVYVPVHTIRERITLEVMDEEKLGKDRSLGQIDVTLADYVKENEQEGGYLVHDTKKVFADGLRMQGKGAAKGTLHYTVSFFPTLSVVDPEDEPEEQEALSEVLVVPSKSDDLTRSKGSSIHSTNGVTPDVEGRKSAEELGKLSVTNGIRPESINAPSTLESDLSIKKQAPKIRLTAEDLPKYQSGLLVFNLIQGSFAHKDVMLEVVMDDHIFPSYSSARVRSREHTFGETGDAFIRELDFSRITLRVVEKVDKEGDDGEEHVVAKLQGQTLQVLSQCLYTPTELTLRGDDGGVNKVTVNLKYLPVQMQLDPSESINNMGTLRVDVLDAAELPAADRNGQSDPYCKFKLNGKEIYKTKTQKKTLKPTWNENFETMISSRTAADFRCDVYDWDFGDKADYLGGVSIGLADLEPFQQKVYKYTLDGKSGTISLRFTFKPSYITRARQGSSTFQGTFAPAGKVVGAPVKGVTKVGGGMVKGASFLKRNFTGRSSSKDEPTSTIMTNGAREGSPAPEIIPTPVTPARSSALTDANSPVTPMSAHNRHSSYASNFQGATAGTDSGTAHFIIVSASGFPEKADVQVHVIMKGAKAKTKELYKTKHLKPMDGVVKFGDDENFKVVCTADTTFQMIVKDHEVFRDKELGEGMFFVSDQGSGSEQTVKCGSGTVVVRSSFALEPSLGATSSDGLLRPGTSSGDASGATSPASKKDGLPRRSFFGKRDASGKVEPA